MEPTSRRATAEVAEGGSGGADSLAVFQRELEELVESCQHPAERRIRYGNLRCEVSENSVDGKVIVNVAVVYETPGGSTTQLNVTHDSKTKLFSYLGEDLEETVTCEDPASVLGMIRRHAQEIPEKRLAALRTQVDAWLAEGKSRREMFGELNKLLQTEFLGGRITNDELNAGIQHTVRQYSKPQT